MRRLLLLICALMTLAAPALAQEDDGSYPDPSYPDPVYPDPVPQGTGYGSINFINQTAFQIDFYIDGSYACRAWASSSCSAQAAVGTRSVSGKTVEDTAREQSDTVEVSEGSESTWTLSGGGDANTGGGPATEPGPGYGTVTFINQTAFNIDFYIDGTYACHTMGTGTCAAQTSPGPHNVSGRTDETPPREETSSIDVGDGGETSWTLSGGGDAPTGYGTFEFFNGTAFSIDFYVDGILACRANPQTSCTAQASVGSHAVTARTVEDTPRDSPASNAEITDGGTTKFEMNGGGEPVTVTGQGTVVFDNQSTYIIDFYIDGLAACRAQAVSACTAAAGTGTHTVTGRTLSEPAFEVAGTVQVADGAQTVYAVANAAGTPPAQPTAPPSTGTGTGTGNIDFQNGMNITVDFYIDGHFLCRAPALGACKGLVPPGGGTSVSIRPAP